MDWASTIREQEASGIGVREFCRQRGLKEGKFYLWRARLRRPKEMVGKFARIESNGAEISLKLSESLTLRVKQEDLGKVLKELVACAR